MNQEGQGIRKDGCEMYERFYKVRGNNLMSPLVSSVSLDFKLVFALHLLICIIFTFSPAFFHFFMSSFVFCCLL